MLLKNLQEALSARTGHLVQELVKLGGETRLREFLAHTQLDVADLYRKDRTFTSLRRAAGLGPLPEGPEEKGLARNLGRMLHNDDPLLLDTVRARLGDAEPPAPTGLDARRWSTALVTLLGEQAVLDLPAALKRLWEHPAIRAELAELLALLRKRVAHVPIACAQKKDVALQVHCRYSGEQIIAAFDFQQKGRMAERREGVMFEEKTRCDLLFVTLQKTEKNYSPSPMYQDCALSPGQFQWETQSFTTPESVRGQRNLDHQAMGIVPLLFVRERPKDDRGGTVAFVFLGPVTLVRHEGTKPMRIVWQLQEPMPADFYTEAKVAA